VSLRTSLSRRAAISGIVGFAAAGTSLALSPTRSAKKDKVTSLEAGIGQKVGSWTNAGAQSIVIARPDEEVQDPRDDGHDQLVARSYKAESLPTVMMVLAYGSAQGGNLQLHRPETCYPGQGFALSGDKVLDFKTLGLGKVQGRAFTATRDQRVERVHYWTRIGEAFPVNSAGEYQAIVRSVIQGNVPDGLLARFSIIGHEDRADDVLAEFVGQMLLSSTDAARRLLVGLD